MNSGIVPGVNYSFRHKGVIFIMWSPTYWGNGASAGSSYLTQHDLNWMNAELAKYGAGEPKVVVNHLNYASLRNRSELDTIFERNNVMLMLSGHWEKVQHWAGTSSVTDYIMDEGCRGNPWNASFSVIHFGRNRLTLAHYEAGTRSWHDKIIKRSIPERRIVTSSKKGSSGRGAKAKAGPDAPPDAVEARRKAIAAAEELARKGKSRTAEAAYREVISTLGDEDAALRAEIELRIAGLGEHDGLTDMVKRGFEAKGPVTVSYTVGRGRRRARLVRADAKGVALDMGRGLEMSVQWKRIGPLDMGDLALAYAASPSDRLAIAKYLLACGEKKAAAAALRDVRASDLPKPEREAVGVLRAAAR